MGTKPNLYNYSNKFQIQTWEESSPARIISDVLFPIFCLTESSSDMRVFSVMSLTSLRSASPSTRLRSDAANYNIYTWRKMTTANRCTTYYYQTAKCWPNRRMRQKHTGKVTEDGKDRQYRETVDSKQAHCKKRIECKNSENSLL